MSELLLVGKLTITSGGVSRSGSPYVMGKLITDDSREFKVLRWNLTEKQAENLRPRLEVRAKIQGTLDQDKLGGQHITMTGGKFLSEPIRTEPPKIETYVGAIQYVGEEREAKNGVPYAYMTMLPDGSDEEVRLAAFDDRYMDFKASGGGVGSRVKLQGIKSNPTDAEQVVVREFSAVSPAEVKEVESEGFNVPVPDLSVLCPNCKQVSVYRAVESGSVEPEPEFADDGGELDF